jgi:hypothetical protein
MASEEDRGSVPGKGFFLFQKATSIPKTTWQKWLLQQALKDK